MPFSKIPLTAARWFLLANIVLAAWLYGGTREWTREWVTWLLLANSGIFLLGVALRRRPPRVPLAASVAVMFLLAQGGFMAWNAQRHFLEGVEIFVDRIQPMPGWPGFWDATMVMPTLLLTVGLLGAFCIACDMAARPEWRERLWLTLALTGVSIVLLGLSQRITEADDIFWSLETRRGRTFFAVFRYHANAGAFINLLLPLTVGLAVRSFRTRGAEAGRFFWTLSALLTAAAGFVNVSKAANAICLILIVVMVVWFGTNGYKARVGRNWFLAVLSILVVAAFAASFGLEKTMNRWADASKYQAASSGGRLQAYSIIVRGALPEAGWWGFGPGTFEKVFNIHRAALKSPLDGRWDKAHSDALQTPMEWGWAGAASWLVLLIGALGKAILAASGRGGDSILGAGCALALAGVMFHALVDFPLQISSLQLLTLVLAGLCWGFGARKQRVLRSPKS
jgi:hypothetical protein